jgi:leucyl aminopeptidase
VGKGVTFDSGGLSIKPTDSMLTMKCDMAGGATVVGVMFALASLKADRPVIGLIGLVENVISGNAFKLGDILHSRAGKSIEVHNTDAEGRLVLADVLNVALDYKPSRIVDFATLTGACVVALGTEVGGLMVNDEAIGKEIEEAAEQVGEYIWQLPMFPLFDDQIQGKVGDLKNVGDGRWGGAITAAKFLEQFVNQTPWAHIDLAGPAFADKPKSWCDAGGTGYMVHTITEWLARPLQ